MKTRQVRDLGPLTYVSAPSMASAHVGNVLLNVHVDNTRTTTPYRLTPQYARILARELTLAAKRAEEAAEKSVRR